MSVPLWLFSLTIFGSAFLLFQVQPMIAKMILPWYGGAAAVWSTCLLFFQVLLLLGYLYAHALTKLFRPAAQARIHLLVIAASALFLPILPKEALRPASVEDPALSLLILLAVTVGLPFFLLATTSPLLQVWYNRATFGDEPYHLYALSNTGSLLALLSYPLLVEPKFSTHAQAWGWSGAYIAVALGCGAIAWGARHLIVEEEPEATTPPPGWKRQVLWASLAACSSALLLAVTYHVSQNIAAIPLLWVLPLSLYLLSFVLTFAGPAFYPRGLLLRFLAVALGSMAYAFSPYFINTSLVVLIPLYLTGLFICAMVCHGELARLRPDPAHLTSFYVMISLGGAIGGLLVALVAPHVLPDFFELHLCLGGCAVLVLIVLRNDPESVFARGRHAAAWYVGVGLTTLLLISLFVGARLQMEDARVTVRNFYGVLKVVDTKPLTVVLLNKDGSQKDVSDPVRRKLMHGTIQHGLQLLGPEFSRMPVSYYGPESGISRALKAEGRRGPLKIGVLGLGAGTLAAFGRPGDEIIFYEINPLVKKLAETEFTFLSESRAKVQIVMGDARLNLEREPPQGFDVFAMDAFSGDAIPMHLLTREALQLYFRHLKPGGVLAVHISNNYLDLRPVLQSAATELHKRAVMVTNVRDEKRAYARAQWVLISDRTEFFGQPELSGVEVPLPASSLPPWTDDYSNMFGILKWTLY